MLIAPLRHSAPRRFSSRLLQTYDARPATHATMMTASKEPDSPFSPDVRARLERAIRSYAAAAQVEQHEELHAAFEQLSAEARNAGLHAEVVLLVVKEIWWRLHAGTAIYLTPQRTAYDRMVRWCLTAYFGESA